MRMTGIREPRYPEVRLTLEDFGTVELDEERLVAAATRGMHEAGVPLDVLRDFESEAIHSREDVTKIGTTADLLAVVMEYVTLV